MTTKPQTKNLCDFHNQPFAEQFILWLIRVWVQAHCFEKSSSKLVLDAFARAKVPHGHARLEEFMTVIIHSAARDIQIFHPCRCEVNPDEKMLLHILNKLQNRPSYDLASDLEGFLAPSGIRIAVDAAGALSHALLDSGIQFSDLEGWKIQSKEQGVHHSMYVSNFIH